MKSGSVGEYATGQLMSMLLDMMMVLDSKLRDHKSSSFCLYLFLFVLKGTWKVFHLIVG